MTHDQRVKVSINGAPVEGIPNGARITGVRIGAFPPEEVRKAVLAHWVRTNPGEPIPSDLKESKLQRNNHKGERNE
jgi:hypothetical protein